MIKKQTYLLGDLIGEDPLEEDPWFTLEDPPIHAILHEEDCELFVRIRRRTMTIVRRCLDNTTSCGFVMTAELPVFNKALL